MEDDVTQGNQWKLQTLDEKTIKAFLLALGPYPESAFSTLFLLIVSCVLSSLAPDFWPGLYHRPILIPSIPQTWTDTWYSDPWLWFLDF